MNVLENESTHRAPAPTLPLSKSAIDDSDP